MSQNYYYGRPDNEDTYDLAMSILAGREKLNSYKTSSLPLAEFWRPEGLCARVKQLLPELDIDLDDTQKCFEYATTIPSGYGRGKASMTDLMLISKKYRVAIEAKYTEYKGLKYDQPIKRWLKEGKKNSDNREQVLKGWLSLIRKKSKVVNRAREFPVRQLDDT